MDDFFTSEEKKELFSLYRHLLQSAGDSISCNILQAYVLLSDDSQGVTQDIVGWLVAQQKMKINAEITVSGKSMKFKKYVVANKDKLSNTANLICEQYKVYSMLF